MVQDFVVGQQVHLTRMSLIKSCADGRASNEVEYEHLVFEGVPDALFDLANSHARTSQERDAILAELTSGLPEQERSRFQERLFKKGRRGS